MVWVGSRQLDRQGLLNYVDVQQDDGPVPENGASAPLVCLYPDTGGFGRCQPGRTLTDKDTVAMTMESRIDHTTPGPAAAGPHGNGKGRGLHIAAETIDAMAFSAAFEAIVENIETVIKGKTDVVRLALVAILCEGHILFEDVPGTGKSMLARAIAQSINATSNRVQCTPDMLPGDITGSSILDQKNSTFEFRPGPIFTNVLLSDEINRATPKTQSALLEGMQEASVTVGGVSRPLPAPFFVLATQNPIEMEGTYPLPEAQRDRFLMKVLIGFPTAWEEATIVRRMGVDPPKPDRVFDPGALEALQRTADGVFVHDGVLDYAVRLVLATRAPAEHGLPDIAPLIAHGASPRATLGLIASGRALALMRGRTYVLPQDVFDVGPDVLRHRLLLSYEALADGVDSEQVVNRILSTVHAPRVAPSQDSPESGLQSQTGPGVGGLGLESVS